MSNDTLTFLHELERVIEQRASADPADSYTATLMDKGPAFIAQKVGEEAVELAIAGVQADRHGMVSEAADLLYHILVLLKARDLGLGDVVAELQSRHR